MPLIFDIKRFAVHDGPGVRTTIFFKGCPLQCAWCHNPESISQQIESMRRERKIGDVVVVDCERVGYEISVDELFVEILKDRVFMEESDGGVSFSGGEPLMQPAFLLQILKKCHDVGLHTVVDTSGYVSTSVIENIAPFTSLFLYDLKLMDDKLHRRFTGVSNALILENLKWLIANNSQVRVRVPVIPEVTATHDNLQRIAEHLIGLNVPFESVDLLPFHNSACHKYDRLGMFNAFAEIASVSSTEINSIRLKFFS